MEVYAQHLATALQAVAGASLRVDHWHAQAWVGRVQRVRKAAGYVGEQRWIDRLASLTDRYLAYQWQARGKNAHVNHIIDHGYGHLCLGLDCRRTVVTFHDALVLKLGAHELPTDAYPRLTILGQRLNLRATARAARIVVDSESGRRDLLRFVDYPPERIEVIPLGVSRQFRPPGRADGGRRGPEVRILHVGHCGVYKNVETILRCLPLLGKQLGCPVRFVKVGGPFTTSQQVLIDRLQLAGQIEHLGLVPLPELVAAYGRADVLLMPSWHEGFGLPVLEAMACGVPVVAANRASLPEVVGDAGLLVEPDDLDDVVDAVRRIVVDPALRESLRRRGLKRASEFTWERTAEHTLAVYHTVNEECA
jgi:glycosyltransferase involved in cell wall biosynthesis